MAFDKEISEKLVTAARQVVDAGLTALVSSPRIDDMDSPLLPTARVDLTAMADQLEAAASEIHTLKQQFENPGLIRSGWAAERESVVFALRDICDAWGDNDWTSDLHLADVIEKHLHNHLNAAKQ